jgi:hypothetical protein
MRMTRYTHTSYAYVTYAVRDMCIALAYRQRCCVIWCGRYCVCVCVCVGVCGCGCVGVGVGVGVCVCIM